MEECLPCIKDSKCAEVLFASDALQEYLPRIKDNDVLRAIEKNTSGSRPKELFEEVLEEVDKQYEADRYLLYSMNCFTSLISPESTALPHHAL